MQKSNVLILTYALLLATAISGCIKPAEQKVVVFSEPQPIDAKNLSEIPAILQAVYQDKNDPSATLKIDGKFIVKTCHYSEENTISPKELDSIPHKMKGDSIFFSELDMKGAYKKTGDSLKIRFVYFQKDTLFALDYDNVMRKFKGYFFINNRIDKNSWEVKKIAILHNALIISRISLEDEIKQLEKITQTPQDTIYPYRTTLTKKQFKEFLKEKSFNKSDTFFRIKQK